MWRYGCLFSATFMIEVAVRIFLFSSHVSRTKRRSRVREWSRNNQGDTRIHIPFSEHSQTTTPKGGVQACMGVICFFLEMRACLYEAPQLRHAFFFCLAFIDLFRMLWASRQASHHRLPRSSSMYVNGHPASVPYGLGGSNWQI